ncbi:MAG: acetolactate synthase small subunit [Thiotrichaceae bacterium]|nr:acetolactate synthase small subunit [Thiotrichaceae bacterium]
MRHTLSILMENESGALSRVAGLFSARGYNIESLNVAVTEDPTLSRLTLVTHANEQVVEQIMKQLNKLIDVVKVVDIAGNSHIERGLMLVKIKASTIDSCISIKQITDIFRGRIIDVNELIYTIQVTGGMDKLRAFIGTLQQEHTILEVVRSGAVGIMRGKHTL